MRLYHTKSRTDVIDNVTVTTHQYDLYMQVDTEMEVRVQPYMSSACLMYNFKPVIQEADLPQTKFIRPKSIYDNRYASVRHRHYDYERRIWELTLEVDQLWQNFNNYVKIEQGLKNANKIMQTDSKGRIFAAIDNMEKHCEPTTRRIAERVLVTLEAVQQTLEGEIAQATSCIGTSDITTDELYALDGIKGNIQEQLEALRDAIDNVVDAMNDIWKAINALKANLGSAMGDFVKKSGDDMTGSLWMHYDGNTYTGPSDAAESFVGVKFNNATSGSKYGGYLYGATMKTHVGLGVRHPSYIGTDREEDWAVAVTSEIDDSSRGVACQFNGTHLRFTNGGRISDPSSTSFTIDFEKFRDWWHTEIAPNGFGEIDS